MSRQKAEEAPRSLPDERRSLRIASSVSGFEGIRVPFAIGNSPLSACRRMDARFWPDDVGRQRVAEAALNEQIGADNGHRLDPPYDHWPERDRKAV
jgi:hypothetical protein